MLSPSPTTGIARSIARSSSRAGCWAAACNDETPLVEGASEYRYGDSKSDGESGDFALPRQESLWNGDFE